MKGFALRATRALPWTCWGRTAPDPLCLEFGVRPVAHGIPRTKNRNPHKRGGIHTLGGVVQPAQALLTVAPNDGPVLIEATVGRQMTRKARTANRMSPGISRISPWTPPA